MLAELLNLRNSFLKEMIQITETATAELASADFRNLSELEKSRDRIIRKISFVTNKINLLVGEIAAMTSEERRQLKLELSDWESFLTLCSTVDQKLLFEIESEKKRTLKDIIQFDKMKKTVNSFRNESKADSGKGFDQKV